MPGLIAMLSKRDCITRKAAGIVNLFNFFIVFLAAVALATADVPQSSCQALPPDALLFEEIPSPSCLRGAFQRVTLHNRSAGNVGSMDDGVVDIQLPFPFRWFGTLYDTVSVGSNSYVTFGGSKMIFDFSLGVFDPPFPSMFIDASDNSMQLLTAGLVPQGWLVHYEGRYDIPNGNPDSDALDASNSFYISSSTLVWELLFFNSGGLQLCTGVRNPTDPTKTLVSAVSHQKSSVFAKEFSLQANYQYKFTTTCSVVNRAILSTPFAQVSGARLNVLLFFTLSAVNVSSWTITLRGPGFSCPPNSTVLLMSSPPSLFSTGMANILASNSNSPVLVISGITGTTINGSQMLSFIVSGISTPNQPQDSVSNLGFAVHDGSNRLVASGNNVQLDAISSHINLDQTPSVELSVPTIMAQVTMRITVSPSAIIFGQYAPQALVITLTGSGWYFDPATVTLADSFALGLTPTSSSIHALSDSTYKITINFAPPALPVTISSITPLQMTIFPITTPHVSQIRLSDIKCGVLNAQGSIIAAGNRGTLPAVVSSTLGSNAPVISFSPPLKSVSNAVLNVKMVPQFWDFDIVPRLPVPPTDPAVVITLSGQGITCDPNTSVTFLLPFSGAVGVANIDTTDPVSPVLRVTISSGSFFSGSPIWFQVGPVSTPLFEQPDLRNITAFMNRDHPVQGTTLVSKSSFGTMDRIAGDMGANAPVIQHVIDNGTGKIIVSFTPSVIIPANSRIIVTLSGIGLTFGESTPVVFASPSLNVLGSASIINEPLNSELIVSIPGEITTGTNVSFSVSPVLASFLSNFTLSSIGASVVDRQGNILASSVSGSFTAEESSRFNVKDYIITAVNGTIVLPVAGFSGLANCNNVINETMPPRDPGSTVVLKSSGSGTLIDCSGTSMRCLVVYRSSITITSVTFKGGASARFVLSSTVRLIKAVYDAAHAAAPQSDHSTAMRSTSASRFEARKMMTTRSRRNKNSKALLSDSAPKQSHMAEQRRARHRRGALSKRNESHQQQAMRRRQLLQSSSFITAMFTPAREECGGCVLVDASGHNASLFDVTFSGCSSVYGGGAFFDVYAFQATKGLASNNVAQQGGGIFVLSSVGSSIRSFEFVNNTVATFLPSAFEWSEISSWGKFSLLPDPSAAAGGGAWFQLLNNAENCSFSDNTALAAGTSDDAWTNDVMRGAHSLGSALFVVQTRSLASDFEARLATLSHLVFRRSKQLCAGWCVAGGALFLGLADGGTKMSNFFFESVVSSATASSATFGSPLAASCKLNCVGPAVALGSCVVIVDMSSMRSSTISDVRAESVSSRAVGSIFGGCMTFMQSFMNSNAVNISVLRATVISVGDTQNSVYGLFAVNSATNATFSGLSSEAVSLQRFGSAASSNVGGIFGGVICMKTSANVRLSNFYARNISLQSSSFVYGGIINVFIAQDLFISSTFVVDCSLAITNAVLRNAFYDVLGGVFHLLVYSDVQIFNTSALNLQLSCLNAADIGLELLCFVRGGVIYSSEAKNGIFSLFSTNKLEMRCRGILCSVGGGIAFISDSFNSIFSRISAHNSLMQCSGAECKVNGMVISALLMRSSRVFATNSANISLSCNGRGCSCSGGLVYVTEVLRALPTPNLVSSTCASCLAHNSISDIQSSNVSVACHGTDCYVLGGIAYVEEVACLTISNVEAVDSVVLASGSNSRASGSVIAVGASNCSLVSGIRSMQSKVSSVGNISQALGGVLSFLSGAVAVEKCVFSHSAVECSGEGCSAMGGFVSAVSTLIYNANYNNFVTLDSSSFSFGSATCSGNGCSASGGVLAIGTSHRASIWLYVRNPVLSRDIRPPQMRFAISGCTFRNNAVSSISSASSSRGGALAIESSVVTAINSTFSANFIVSGGLVAFAGGGAVSASQSSCSFSAQDCEFSFNNASSIGQGGGILASVGASVVVSKSVIRHNYAGKGGGVLIDAAEAQISNSQIQNNTAVSSGGGMFCSSNQANDFFSTRGLAITGRSAITLKNVSFRGNVVVDPLALGVGADVFIIGSVLISADSASEILMNGNSDRDVTAAVVSVVTNSPNISFRLACTSGTMLRLAPTSLSNLVSLSNPPSLASMEASKCFPACSEVPSYESYRATSGFLASCTPCPRGTYSFGVSNVTSDTVSTYCRPCPFGAVCGGGNAITSQNMHWGWKQSEFSAASQFVFLKSGYGCKNCTSISSCSGRRNGILCGGCEAGYSLALFQMECAPIAQCQLWKAGVVVGMCFLYQLLFSLFLFWSVESELLAKKFELIMEKETALSNIPIFEKLQAEQLRVACAHLVEQEIAADTTLLSQGEPGESMFIVREGTFDVFIKPTEGREKKVAELRAPHFFGELSFLGKSPCLATVRAATPCKVWVLGEACIKDIDDAVIQTFIKDQNSGYISGASHNHEAPLAKISLYECFDVLIWFYQLAGIMLTMSSPLDYLDGSAIAYSLVSFILNTRPSTDSVSTANSAAMGESSVSPVLLSNKFAFCIHEDSNAAIFFGATLLYYVCWMLIMFLLSRGSAWLHVRRVIVVFFRTMVRPLSKIERVRLYMSTLDERLASSFETQGAVSLRWTITCFSAVTILMLQGTQCLRLDGIDAPGGDLRWLYDGRVACFSNDGQVHGTWQIGSAVGVAVCLILPAALMLKMMAIEASDAGQRSEMQSIAYVFYSGPYAQDATHWTVVMCVPPNENVSIV
jgi:hypothetical protein